MSGDILSIGKTGLYAAQAGLATTGHNITNANVAGYSRQRVVQATAVAIQSTGGFYGTGTQIASVQRFTDEFLNNQVRSAQASKSAFDSYYSQISQIDNLLADSTSGLSPALQDFFAGVHNLTGYKPNTDTRQSLMSAGETLASRFQQMNGRLEEIRAGVNSQITSSITMINSYAEQIANLNAEIAGFAPTPDRMPNDLLDKRDQLVMELNKYVKADVKQGDNYSLTVSIGSGMPLVAGTKAYKLAAVSSPTDASRVSVGYMTSNKVTVLPDNALPGGELGGLLDFRSNALDRAQNSLGRIAIGLAQTFNDQHRLGLDANAQQGKDFFSYGEPFIGKNANNNALSTTNIDRKIVDPTALTLSDYKLEYSGSAWTVIRLSDKHPTPITTNPQVVDGVEYTFSGTAAAGDNFLVRPTVNGAADFKLALTDKSQIAAAAPIATSKPLDNTGTGSISAGTVDESYFAAPLGGALTFTFNGATGNLDVIPATMAVTVKVGTTSTTYPPGTPVPYTADASYSVGGMHFTMTGVPQAGDKFVIEPNSGLGDTRNASLLAGLQTKNIFDNGTATYQSTYAEMVNFVGNKTREVEVNGKAAAALLTQVNGAAQSVAGVNLDEEATNLLRYQQAYQASGKIMQIASTIFDTLLSIGR